MSKHESRPGIDDPELLTQVLSRHDVSCPVCRYNLRGVESTCCPECGADLGLQVGIGDLRMGAWIVSLVAACFALGFLTSISIFMPWLDINMQVGVPWFAWSATLGLSMIIIALILEKRRFLSTSKIRRRVVAGGIVLISAFPVGVCLMLLSDA